MKYKCKKCGTEFSAQYEIRCPQCGATSQDCAIINPLEALARRTK